jgi:tetratricopeptide (TPR) repeat protein
MNRSDRRRQQKRRGKSGIALAPGEARRLFSEANSHLSRGDTDAAEHCYRKLLAADPGNADVLNMLSILAGQRGNYRDACHLIRKAIRTTPGQPTYYSNLGLALRGAGKLEDAVAAFRKAIALDPGLAQAHNNLGSTLKRQGNMEAAIAAYREAVRIDPDYRDARHNLAELLLHEGRLEEAGDLIERALRQSPADHDLQRLRGQWHMERGEFDTARQVLVDSLLAITHTWTPPRPSSKKTARVLNRQLAGRALLDLKHILDGADVEFFLRGGTLLGCIREGDFLAHDKDVDIGVFETIGKDELVQLITAAPQFRLQAEAHEQDNRVSFSVLHANGTFFDIYFHKDLGDQYRVECFMPGKSFTRTFTKFTLKPVGFAGSTYLVPENHDRYLTELYGDWRIPDPYFDSLVSAQNLDPGSEIISTCYAYSRLSDALQKADNERASAYCKQALELDPGNKVITQVLAWL